MKTLVVGGNGFIGSHLVDRLIELGWEITVLDIYERRYEPLPREIRFIKGDLTQDYLVREAMAGADVVFHLAWGSIHEVSNRDPAADVHTNLIPSIHLIEAAKIAGVGRFIFTSSGGTVYGPAQTLPISEDHPLNPVNGYGVTKLAVEKYLHMFSHLYDLDYAIIRPSVPYGPRQNPLGRQGAVAVFLYRIAHGLPLDIWGDGSVTRDYFYITDLVNALVACASQPLGKDRVFNIGGAEEVSLNKLIAYAEQTVGKEAIVNYQPARKFDAPRLALDTSRVEQALGWQAQTGMEEGLAIAWKWMSEAIK